MTRKDYKLIANVLVDSAWRVGGNLGGEDAEGADSMFTEIVDSMSKALAQDNPRFSVGLFRGYISQQMGTPTPSGRVRLPRR